MPQVFPSHSKQSEFDSSGSSDSESESEEEQEYLDWGGEGIELQDLSRSHPSADPVERDSAESLAFHDRTHFQLSLRVLGLMCDGQNRLLQVHSYYT